MKNIINTIKEMNKKVLVIIGVIIIILIALIVLLFCLNGTKKITCTLEEKSVEGFIINENVEFNLTKDKITEINLDKSVEITGEHANFETFQSVIKTHFESAYNYISDKDKKLTSKKNKEMISVNIKKGGIVLNNLTISLNDPSNKYDIQFNTVNNLDTEKNVYKINDEYKKDDLIKEVEKAGYKCQ